VTATLLHTFTMIEVDLHGFFRSCIVMEYPPEQMLFRKVIEQAIRDVTHAGVSREHVSERDVADQWLRGTGDDGDKDFRLVCCMAGLDPDAVRERFICGLIDRRMIERVHDG